MDSQIVNVGPISKQFKKVGIESFSTACEFVKDLPYGRTSTPDEYQLVLVEGRGTCSSKHALLVALGMELGLNVGLMVGIYNMSQANTPGVGAALSKAGFSSIPEAHCYLTIRGVRRDFTGGDASRSLDFLHEEEISPDQIGAHKRSIHRKFLCNKYGPENLDQVWNIRESCIAALESGRGK